MAFGTPADEADYDRSLIRRILDGDRNEPFTDIVTRYRGRVFSAARRFLDSSSDAEEVTNDAFIRALNGLPRFRNDCAFSTWLHNIAFNLAKNRYWYNYRRMSHCSVSMEAPISEQSHATMADFLETPEYDPARTLDSTELSDLVTRAMSNLRPIQKNILEFRIVQHLSYLEISKRLGVNIGTVKSRVARARESLRAEMARLSGETL